MTNLFIRKFLRKLGILEIARWLKRGFAPVFMPAKPYLLVSVNKSLRWCVERGLAEGSDYLEFGIYRGFTLWYAQALARDMGIVDMRFFGFDSFSGLPPIKGTDRSGGFLEGDFSCSRKTVKAFLDAQKTDWEKTFLIDGWFEKTLLNQTQEKFGLRRCSICVVDSDLYESARLVLQFIEPLIADQTIIIFDDWYDFGNNSTNGEQRAFSEFLEKHPDIRTEPFITQGHDSQGFILHF